jgi:hypothetical protein
MGAKRMTDKDLKEIYKMACATKGFEPSDGQYKIWKQTLGWCDPKDLEKAIVEYFTTNQNFPMPAELKPLAEAARLKRVRPTTGYEFTTGYRCPRCALTVTSFNQAREMRCERCWKGGYVAEIGGIPAEPSYSLMSVVLQERKARGADQWEYVLPQPGNINNPLPDFLRRASGDFEDAL